MGVGEVTPDDRRVAREALESGRLTVEQVEEIRAAAEADGLSFAEAAQRRGVTLAAPPPPLPPKPLPPPPPAVAPPAPQPPPSSAPARLPLFPVLLALSLAVLVAAVWLTVVRALLDASEHGDAEAETRALMDAETAAARARASYEKTAQERDAARAAEALAQARKTMASAETRMEGQARTPDELRPPLLEAAQRFGVYLAVNPDDPGVLLERARAWELYGLTDRARADLEQAVRLEPTLAPRAAPILERLKKD